jgi:hypothetical protein
MHFALTVGIAALLVGVPALAAPNQAVAPSQGPDAKICEVITVTGSRLATKRICATRAEWDERRRSDREEIDRAQRSPCVVNGTTCK